MLFCRLHHCIADGIALLHVLLSLCDDATDAPWPAAQPGNEHRPAGLAVALWRPAGAALSAAQTVAHEGVDLLRNPTRAVTWAQMAAGAAQSMTRVTLMRPDSHSVFKGQLSVARRMAWSQPLPLDAVKALSRATGATVNDVMVSTLAGALQRYIQDQDPSKVRMRAMMPVNLRPAGESPEALGNRFGLYAPDLPMGLMANARLAPDPEAIVGAFEAEFATLQAAVTM